MQLRHFRYFIAAAEAGSLLKAAGRLRVAQPSLSRQIRDLEREVGVALFDRLPRGLRLTAAGHAFLPEARTALEAAARAVASARHEGAQDHVLRVAHGTLFQYARTVSKLMAEFCRVYPDSHVAIERLNETRQQAALRENNIDVAISLVLTQAIPDFNIALLVDAAVDGVVIPARHDLAHREEVSLPDLDELTWLHVSSAAAPMLYRSLKASLLMRGLNVTRERTRPRESAVTAMYVAAGNAWVLANRELGQMMMDGNPDVVYRPFTESPIPCWLALLTMPEAKSPNVERLLDVASHLSLVPAEHR